jgi:hypothetical protein
MAGALHQMTKARVMPLFWATDDVELDAQITYVGIALETGAQPEDLVPSHWKGSSGC